MCCRFLHSFLLVCCGLFSRNFHLRGTLKMPHCDIFFTGCSIPTSASYAFRVDSFIYFKFLVPEHNRAISYTKKEKTPSWCPYFFGADDVLQIFALISSRLLRLVFNKITSAQRPKNVTP